MEIKNNKKIIKTISFNKLDSPSYKRGINFPYLEIITNNDIKTYENNPKNIISIKNKLKEKTNNFKTLTNNSNLNHTNINSKAYFNLNTFSKVSSPVKKKSNIIKFRKINNLNNKNLTESKKSNQIRLIKMDREVPNLDSMNIVNLKVNDNFYKNNFDTIVNNKTSLVYKILNINFNNKNNKIKFIEVGKRVRCI